MGSQWGDEGKGKVVDILAGKMDMVVRFQGGANAGHTIVSDGQEYILHLIPSGIISGDNLNIIGNGCVVDPEIFTEEIVSLEKSGIKVTPENLMISAQSHIVTPMHKHMDKVAHAKIGTTGRGIGPCYVDKINRTGIRAGDLQSSIYIEKYQDQTDYYRNLSEKVYNQPFIDTEAAMQKFEKGVDSLRPFIGDTIPVIADYCANDRRILYEGAQGTFLDIDHGTYPFVTSSNTTIGGAFSGGGVYVKFDRIIGIVKAYTTRVGEGPFPTEQINDIGGQLRDQGHEYGATTGRPRRCGWLDLQQLRRSFMINGFNTIVLTKLDCLSVFDTIKVALEYTDNSDIKYKEFQGWEQDISHITDYNALPNRCREYIEFIEAWLNVPIGIISTGPDRKSVIVREKI
jgi:adenylosuccinate synthase